MKGIERFVELCIAQWPKSTLSFHVLYFHTLGQHRLQVEIDGWLSPPAFDEADLTQPHAILDTLRMNLDATKVSFLAED